MSALRIGTTSYALRYRYLDAATAPPLETQLEPLQGTGIGALQICENVRPLELSPDRWDSLQREAARQDIRLTLGCMTMRLDTVRQYLDRAAAIGCPTLRLILETEGTPERGNVTALLDAVLPLLEGRDMRLAIENHFHLPSAFLAEVIRPYPASRVGVCLDVANSLRNFESPETVFDLLEDRAFMYHFKDYRVEGSNVGFQVKGAPLGAGRLDLAGLLWRVGSRNPEPEIYLENWVPDSGVPAADAETDLEWLRQGVAAVRRLLE